MAEFAATFAKLGNAAAEVAFEQRFNLLQNQVITRLNKKIEAVNANDENAPEVRELQRKHSQLAESIPVIQKYVFDNDSNNLKLGEIVVAIANLQNTFNGDGNPADVTAAEAAAFTTQRDALVSKFNYLTQLFHSNVTDGNVIQYLKNEVANIQALTPTVGVVDAEGAPATNGNRAILTYLSSLSSRAAQAQEGTVNTTTAANHLLLRMLRKAKDIEATFTELTAVQKARKSAEVKKLQEQNAQILQAISLSYEVSKGIFEGITSSLSPRPIPKGSVLNMFT